MNYENELIEKGINNNTISFVRRIYETYDYDIFGNTGETQRPIKSSIISKILFSMEIEVLPIPIIVNQDMRIIDGHHLCSARMKRELPILFYVMQGADDKVIRMINLPRTNWNTTDLVKSFLESKDDRIKVYAELLIKKAKLPSGLIGTFLSTNGTSRPLNYLQRDLINEAMGDWVTFDELINRIDIYMRYKRSIKANRVFYSVLFANPKYDCKTLEETISLESFKNIINRTKVQKDMEERIIELIKMGGRSKK